MQTDPLHNSVYLSLGPLFQQPVEIPSRCREQDWDRDANTDSVRVHVSRPPVPVRAGARLCCLFTAAHEIRAAPHYQNAGGPGVTAGSTYRVSSLRHSLP